MYYDSIYHKRKNSCGRTIRNSFGSKTDSSSNSNPRVQWMRPRARCTTGSNCWSRNLWSVKFYTTGRGKVSKSAKELCRWHAELCTRMTWFAVIQFLEIWSRWSIRKFGSRRWAKFTVPSEELRWHFFECATSVWSKSMEFWVWISHWRNGRTFQSTRATTIRSKNCVIKLCDMDRRLLRKHTELEAGRRAKSRGTILSAHSANCSKIASRR